MKCKFCGNNVPDGEVYCSCGNPVTYSTSENVSEMMNNPAGTPVMTIKKQGGMPRALVTIIVIIVTALATFGYQYYKNVLSITNSTFYHEVSTADFTMEIPKSLKKDSTSENGVVAFYTSEKAAVNICKLSYSENPALKSIELKDFPAYAKIGGFTSDFTIEDDLIYASYNDTATSVLGKKQECYVIEGIYKGDDALWSVNAYCRVSDKEKYEDALLEWIKSFELK